MITPPAPIGGFVLFIILIYCLMRLVQEDGIVKDPVILFRRCSLVLCHAPVISKQAMPNNALTVEALEFLPKCDDFDFMSVYVFNPCGVCATLGEFGQKSSHPLNIPLTTRPCHRVTKWYHCHSFHFQGASTWQLWPQHLTSMIAMEWFCLLRPQPWLHRWQ